MAEIDRKKVIEILSRHKTMTFGDLLHDGIKFDLGDVVTLLKEQEAVTVHDPGANCPKCGWMLCPEDHTHNCGNCGQKVKWDD